jgi:hypothetical protein
MKKCPYCGKEYPDEASVCAIDQEPLESDPPTLGQVTDGKALSTNCRGPLMWIGLCFLVTAVCYWWPTLAGNFRRDPTDKDIPKGAVMVFGPSISFSAAFFLAAGIGSILACRRLIVMARRSNGRRANLIIAFGLMLTAVTALPALLLLLVVVYACYRNFVAK